MARDYRNPSYSCEQVGDSELSFGPGLVAPHLNGAPPAEGGIYAPKCPPVDPPASGVGPPRQAYRSATAPRGYPGEIVAR